MVLKGQVIYALLLSLFIISAPAYSQNINLQDTINQYDYTIITKDLSTAVEGNPIPLTFSLTQNYPNPFNPSCQISFTLTEGAFTSLKIYDLLGREAAVLVNEYMTSGTHTIDFKAENMSSGVYFYNITSGKNSQTKKMVLLR